MFCLVQSHRFLKRVVACTTAISLIGSSGPLPVQAQTTSIWETRVFIHDWCPTEKPPDEATPAAFGGVLLSAFTFLLPKLVDFGLSFVNKHLQEKKKEEEEKNNARSTSGVTAEPGFYRLQGSTDPKLELLLKDRCLVLVRGNFGKPTNVPGNDCAQFKQAAFRTPHACEWLQKQGVYGSTGGDEGAVGIYLEAKTVFSEEGTSFRLQPNYLSYRRPLIDADDQQGRYDISFTIAFEATAAGQNVTPFGVAILAFQQLTKPTTLDPGDLIGKSSAWTPVLALTEPLQAEVKRIKDLYETRETLTNKIPQLALAIGRQEAKARMLLGELSGVASPPPAPPANVFGEGEARAAALASGERFDDTLTAAQLDTDPNTAGSITPDALQAAQRKVSRQQAIRRDAAYRAKVLELKSVAEDGTKLLVERARAQAELNKRTETIATWENGERLMGPFSVRVTMTEQPFLPKNIFLLTAAEAFAASQKDLSGFITQSVTQGLGLESKDIQIGRIEAQGKLLLAAMGTLNAARDAQFEADNLPADATEQTKRAKELALEIARFNANIAHLKAGLQPPFPEATGAR
jgi:hypothetical protein